MQCEYCKNKNECHRIISLGIPCHDFCADTTTIKVGDVLYGVCYSYESNNTVIKKYKVAEIHDCGIDIVSGMCRIGDITWASLGWCLFRTFEEAEKGAKYLEMQVVQL